MRIIDNGYLGSSSIMHFKNFLFGNFVAMKIQRKMYLHFYQVWKVVFFIEFCQEVNRSLYIFYNFAEIKVYSISFDPSHGLSKM